MAKKEDRKKIDELLEGYAVVVEWPVAWRDMDVLQHVNNVKYFEYFEHARIVYGEKCGTVAHGYRTGIGPILADIRIKFLKPLYYPDTVSLATGISRIEKTQYQMKFAVVSHAQKALVAVGECLNVFFDYNRGRRADIPAELIEKIEKIEGTSLAPE